MALIRPSADLRNNYNEISKLCHETKQPVYITKNGFNDLVVLSNEAYEELTEENIERLVAKEFDKHYASFEEYQKDILDKIEIALKQVEEGKCIPFEDFCKEMEEKYDIHK